MQRQFFYRKVRIPFSVVLPLFGELTDFLLLLYLGSGTSADDRKIRPTDYLQLG